MDAARIGQLQLGQSGRNRAAGHPSRSARPRTPATCFGARSADAAVSQRQPVSPAVIGALTASSRAAKRRVVAVGAGDIDQVTTHSEVSDEALVQLDREAGPLREARRAAGPARSSQALYVSSQSQTDHDRAAASADRGLRTQRVASPVAVATSTSRALTASMRAIACLTWTSAANRASPSLPEAGAGSGRPAVFSRTRSVSAGSAWPPRALPSVTRRESRAGNVNQRP